MVMLTSSGNTNGSIYNVNLSSVYNATTVTYSVTVTVTNVSASEMNDLMSKASASVAAALNDVL